tara:strand:+ start:173 stop:697 length:525 start_codon:yes stop_codon:yes gene_type:complete
MLGFFTIGGLNNRQNEKSQNSHLHKGKPPAQHMSDTRAYQNELTTNDESVVVKTFDRSTGTIADPTAFSLGSGAVLAKASKGMMTTDRDAVNGAGAKITKNPVDLTIVDNITGATTQITGDATIGLDSTTSKFHAYGTKNLLRVALLRSGCTRGSLATQLINALRMTMFRHYAL